LKKKGRRTSKELFIRAWSFSFLCLFFLFHGCCRGQHFQH
jgi:hypothetical protein